MEVSLVFVIIYFLKESPGLGRSLEKGMATHSSILAWRILMDRSTWRATVHGGRKESDMTEWLSTLPFVTKSPKSTFRVYLSLSPLEMMLFENIILYATYFQGFFFFSVHWFARSQIFFFSDLKLVWMRWMKLEPIIQSEVSQKDKEHYSILTRIYGI